MAVFAVHSSAAETQERNLSVNATQGKRIALVIGNSAYKDSPLKNPVNDARDMAATLRKLGFDVIEKTDANQKDMNRAIAQFGEKLRSDTVALFFYAGHGIQVRGKNYIIPVDAQVTSEASVRVETVDVDSVMDQLAVSPMNIVILDACRNNPFERKFRSVGGGLAQMDAPKGSLIAYATAPGKTAADGSGRNGLYTQELLKSIQAPGLTLEAVFKRVRNGVMAASGEAQTPWESSSLTGDFYFTGPTPIPVPVAAPVAPAALAATRPGASDPAPIEVMLWESVKAATTVGELQAYLNRYPNGFFAEVAKARIAVMNGGAKEKALADGTKKVAEERAAAEEAQRVAKERAEALTAQKVAAERAELLAAQKAAAERANTAAIAQAAKERVQAEAEQKAATERANVAAQQASRERAEAIAAQKTADEKALIEVQKQANAKKHTEEQLESVSNPAGPIAATTVYSGRQPGEVIGTLVTKGLYSGRTESTVEVKILEAGNDKTVYSSGDVIGRDGSVLQVRVGDLVLTKVSGNLWTLPLKAGISGEAKVSRGNETSMIGAISWKTQSTATGHIQLVADVWYYNLNNMLNSRTVVLGNWTAGYSDSHALPDSTRAEFRGSGGFVVSTTFNLLTAGAAQTQPTALPIIAPQAVDKPVGPITTSEAITDRHPGEIIGTLVTKDSLTGNTVSNVDVKILEAGPDKTVYSSGDVIGRDGSVLQVRVGEVVLKKLSGNLWTLPLKAGTSGEAKVMSDNQADMTGTIRWKSHSAAEGVQIVADVVYSVYITTAARITRSPSGKWTANYRGTHALPESTETSIQATIYSNMVSTKLNLVTAAVTSGSAGPLSRQVIKDCTACPELVAIPAGDFAMGSNDGGADEKPIHRVNIKSFAMGKTEITQGQWTAVMGRNPSKFKDCGDNCPLEQVSWDDAQQYIQKLNTLSGLRYDLPSEAQWEYAARAGSAAKWYFGSDEGQLGRYAWTNANSNSKTQEVAQKQSNDFGLHDMHGNVGEWVQDCWNATYDAAPADGSAWLGGNCGERVWRGGSWDAAAQLTRAAVRHRSDPVLRSASHLGFRVARALP